MRLEHPTLDREDALSTALHTLNNTAGQKGLVTVLLVFGVYLVFRLDLETFLSDGTE